MKNLLLKTDKTVDELNKIGYVYRHKKIVFNSGATPTTPQRKDDYPDESDIFFLSKQDFQDWHKSLTAGLAELDQCLNFCKHFVREKGNIGYYIRGDKVFYPVDGTWCGIHDYTSPGKEYGYSVRQSEIFFNWVKEEFGKDWYELMDRYKNLNK